MISFRNLLNDGPFDLHQQKISIGCYTDDGELIAVCRTCTDKEYEEFKEFEESTGVPVRTPDNDFVDPQNWGDWELVVKADEKVETSIRRAIATAWIQSETIAVLLNPDY